MYIRQIVYILATTGADPETLLTGEGGGSKMISYVHKTDSIYTSYNRGGSRDSVDGGGGGAQK